MSDNYFNQSASPVNFLDVYDVSNPIWKTTRKAINEAREDRRAPVSFFPHNGGIHP